MYQKFSHGTLQSTIQIQRKRLTALLGSRMMRLAAECGERIDRHEEIESLLDNALGEIEYCKHLYVLDINGIQITDNITREGRDPSQVGRDRSQRPYMLESIGRGDFNLSEAYISRNRKRPSLTAIQIIRNQSDKMVGYLGADYDLRELPGSEGLYQEPGQWRQIKGDPAIRGALFLQNRVTSRMDEHIDDVLSLMNALIVSHGIFHGKLHFSSSRASVWLVDDPYAYRILPIEALIDPDICLAYPRRDYTKRAVVPVQAVAEVFSLFKALRFADETIYLRSGSINVCNGLVSLNFSCDGSHYLHYDEFLSRGLDLWFGALNQT